MLCVQTGGIGVVGDNLKLTKKCKRKRKQDFNTEKGNVRWQTMTGMLKWKRLLT